ncbi:hypothetical protein [Halomonas sp.]|uniref:hypothetical protein n=1 Tax=Halomonas sp. TaxID=1486246 RepID=UPI00298EA270|nr:hypothetical protein [Halomonas sp.]MDW7748799.1 hypothetical protein [Halomonas sp.]
MSTARNIVPELAMPDPVVSPSASPVGTGPSPVSLIEASLPVCDWWRLHWMDASHPMIRLHQAWMASLVEAAQLEVEFLSVCTLANSRVASCLADPWALRKPADLARCCQDAAREVVDAQEARLDRVTQLPKEFRQRLWEEIC